MDRAGYFVFVYSTIEEQVKKTGSGVRGTVRE